MNKIKYPIHISFIVNERQLKIIKTYSKEKGVTISKAVRDIIDKYEEDPIVLKMRGEEYKRRIKINQERLEELKRKKKEEKKGDNNDGRKEKRLYFL